MKIASALFCMLAATAVHAGVLLNEGFEGGNLPFDVSGTAPLLSLETANSGRKSLKIDLDYYTSETNYRQELTNLRINGDKSFHPGETYWIAVSVMIPQNWNTNTTLGDIVFQMHAEPDAGEDNRNPPFALHADGSNWKVTYLGDNRANYDGTDYQTSGNLDLGIIEKGRWTRFAFQFKVDWSSTGFLRAYRDGVLKGAHNGQIFFNDAAGPYLKMGLYRPAWRDTAIAWGHPDSHDRIYHRTLYLDDVMIGDSTATLADMGGMNAEVVRPTQDISKLIFLGDYEVDQITVPAGSGSGTPIRNTFFYAGMGPNCEDRGNDPRPDNGSRLVTSPVLSGAKAMRMEIRYDCDYRPFNGGDLQKPRSETKALHPNAQMLVGEEYWLGFGFFLDSNFIFDYAANPDNLFQLVKEEDGTTGGLGKNMIDLTLVEGDAVVNFQHPDGLENPKVDSVKWAATRGMWHQVVFNFRLCKIDTPNCDGFIKLYTNGSDTPIYSDRGPNTISDTQHATVNFYKYAWHCTQQGPGYTGEWIAQSDYPFCMRNPNPTKHNASHGPRVVTFDNFNIGLGNATIFDVMPSWGGLPAAPPPNIPIGFIIQ
jgi:hypothetical protein